MFVASVLRIFSTPNIPELRALHNPLDGPLDAIIVLRQVGSQIGQKRPIRQLDRSPQGVPEQFATELPDEGIATLREQVIAQPIESIEFRAIQHFRLRFDGPIRQIAITMPANSIETFQGKAVGINPNMAACAAGIGAMLLDQLPDG